MATLKMPFELVKPSNSVPVTRTTEIWDAQGNTLDSLLAAINTQLAQGGGGSSEPIDLTGYVTTSVFNQQLALKANQSTVDEHTNAIADIEAKLFPLTVEYTAKDANAGKLVEYGTSITPSVSFRAKRKSEVAITSVTLGSSTNWGTLSADNKTYTGTTGALTSTKTFSATLVTANGSKSLSAVTWTPSFYRYFGEVDAVPTDYAATIRTLNKELSTGTTWATKNEPCSLAADKYYLFAVKSDTPVTFKVYTGESEISTGVVTGSVVVPQENGYGDGNTYYYCLVPKSTIGWSFFIKNS